MRLNKKILVFIAALACCVQGSAHAQSATDRLQRLVETSAQRLAIAEQVALAKWDSGSPVEDTSREAQVLASAVKEGESKGLDQAAITNSFRAQIEANKLVQYSLLAEWRRLDKAPYHEPVNLATIRPQLDQLDAALIVELANTSAVRARASCRTDIAKAVGKYVATHKNSFNSLKVIALDRATAGACS